MSRFWPNKNAGANAGFRVGFKEALSPGVAQLDVRRF
jgi:hypothetical protein